MRWTRKRFGRPCALAVMFGAIPGWAYAQSPASLYGLYNTGVNATQDALLDDAVDPHYKLIEGSLVEGDAIVATSAGGFPIPPWLADSHLSAWITPSTNTNGPGNDDGSPSYIYRTTFNLNDVNLNDLTLNGQWATDNAGLDILLNGSSLGFTNTAQFGSYTPFTLEDGFINGLNTLDFVINNGANEAPPSGPSGLRVQWEGNGNAAPPLPPPHPRAITTLYPTGAAEDRRALTGNIVTDPHYTLVDSPNGAGPVYTVPEAFPIPPWFGNDQDSRWVSPSDVEGSGANGTPGTYVYQTSFDMTGHDVNRSVIVFSRGTDDSGPAVLLNGVEIQATPSLGFGSKSWVAITAKSALEAGAELKAGVNTLAFQVDNGGEADNPTGLRIDDVFARSAPAGSQRIPGLYNTGVGNDDVPIGDFEADPHYTAVSAPDGSELPVSVLSGPPGVWAGNSGSSRWIGPTNTPAGEGPPGEYSYEISFDLTGLDPGTAVIMGTWSADDIGGDILLNGVPTGNPQLGGFGALSPFEISQALGDAFLPGVNKLTFPVTNGGEANNPTGFRVEGLLAWANSLGGLLGDFNSNGTLDAADIDLLSAAVRGGNAESRYDLNSDSLVNGDDRLVWINTLKKTWVGDSNLDGEFNTTDLVSVFQAGQYEDGVSSNSTWATGDWNGDAEFDTQDFIAAFQAGGFEAGPRAAVASVPEPSCVALGLLGLLPLVRRRR